MGDESSKTNDVKNFYDAVAVDYHGQYSDKNLTDIGRTYPANYFRLQILATRGSTVRRALTCLSRR